MNRYYRVINFMLLDIQVVGGEFRVFPGNFSHHFVAVMCLYTTERQTVEKTKPSFDLCCESPLRPR